MKKENDWQHHYSVLNARDRENPFLSLIISRYTQSLFETRGTLNEMLQAALTNENPRYTAEDRVKMVSLYFSLLRLIEASYLIAELWDDGKFTYNIGLAKKKK